MKKDIYFAGGCFWGTEKVFKILKGVTDTETGYANGNTVNPSYKLVCTGTTDARETVRVTYDSEQITLPILLRAFFLCIDPTQKNQQAHDIGTQYQTGIYYVDNDDLNTIRYCYEREKRKYSEFHVEFLPLKNFYSAEEYHQDYLDKNPNGYCHITPVEYDRVRQLNCRIYFSGSISGGRNDGELYRKMIDVLSEKGAVLTEHVGYLELNSFSSPQEVYDVDTGLLKHADLLVAEVTTPSLGVGYELAYAEKLNIPCHVFCRRNTRLSSMISGNSFFKVSYYDTEDELMAELSELQ